MRGASHHSAFMGNCWTISHMFCSLIYPVDEGNEVAWGQSKDLKFWKVKIMGKKCVAWLQRSEISVGRHVISLILRFYSCGMAAVAEPPWPSGQCNNTQPQRPQFERRAEHTPTSS